MTTGPAPARRVTVLAPAKVNLQLAVGPPRPDGFHPLATVYQAVSLYDEITVAPSRTTTLTIEGEAGDVAAVPAGPDNLVLRAADLLARHAGLSASDASVAVWVSKRIPVAGGMAGGSTDAAGALVACDALWGLHTPLPTLLSLAADLGSDVPFCLLGGTASGRGRGEVVAPLTDRGRYWWVVVSSPDGLPTPAVFSEYDRQAAHAGADGPASGFLHGTSPVAADPVLADDLLRALAAGDARHLAATLANDLQGPALSLRPDLADVLKAGAAPPSLGGLVSGSGPTCLFLAADEADARVVRDRMAARVSATGGQALAVHGPVPGARVVDAV